MMPAMKKAIQIHDLDIQKFAKEGAEAEGELPLSAFARVCAENPADFPTATLPPVRWQAQGLWRDILGQTLPFEQSGIMGQPWLGLRLSAQVARTCQRCLQPVVLPMESERLFRFVADEATAAEQDEDSAEDVLVWSRHFNLHELMEDELLLELPFVPMHEACAEQAASTPEADSAVPSSDTHKPFADLAALIKNKKD